MGVYDRVTFDPPIACFRCEADLDGFQTKDSPDQSLYTRVIRNQELLPEVTIQPRRNVITNDVFVEAQSFLAEDTPSMVWMCYTHCAACLCWNEYELTIENNIVVRRTLVVRTQSPYNLQS